MNTAELPPNLRFDRSAVESYLRSYPLARWIPSVLHDVARVPAGPVLLVGNHGPLAIDTGLLMHAFHRETGIVLRGLSDRMLFSNPIGRQIVRNVGAVKGTRDNARELLAHGELVLVYPGGARETTRDPRQRYQLAWEGRFGFARMALEAQVPIVPVACIGADDLFAQLVDSTTMRASLAGRFVSRFIKPDYIPPLYLPKLRATQFHYYFGQPIQPVPVPDSDVDETTVRAHQRTVKDALEALIDHGRAVRRERLQRKKRVVA
ncbi:MAG: putative acyltransferase [Myxococcaceae bacterium]|nr:putative acyltransferase [Myxococcaceae bacterium]